MSQNRQNSGVLNTFNGQQKSHVVLTLDPELDLDLSGKGNVNKPLSGTIHPFHKSHSTFYGKFHEEIGWLLSVRKTRRICVCFILNVFVIIVLLNWFTSTKSIALLAFTTLSCYDALSLLTCLVTSWSIMKQEKLKRSLVPVNMSQSVSYERSEILAVFSSVVIAQLGAVFITKEAIERVLDQQEIHVGRLIPAVIVGFSTHILLSCFVENKAFQSVREASSSSWMQEHATDISHTICGFIPILRGILLPRVDPLLLVYISSAVVIIILDLVLQIEAYYSLDTIMALIIVSMIFGTMWPIAVCSANVLLQTTSPYVLSQLDKLLSEAQRLDGVLEIRNESFYTLSLNGHRGMNKVGHVLVGSVQVRVRRDADEQLVLAHVTNRLSPLVPHITVQVVKDDWASTGNLQTSKILQSHATRLGGKYGFDKPAAAVKPMVQTPPREAAAVKQNDDFNFTSPAKGAASKISVVKPRSSHTDIEKMFKAAGLSAKSLNKSSSTSLNNPMMFSTSKFPSPFPKQPIKSFPVLPSSTFKSSDSST